MEKLIEDVREYVLDQLNDEVGLEEYGADLHHNLLNMDYFIVGTYKAKKWLGDNTFDAIEKIREYEQNNFGEVNTKFDDPESVANMLAYVLGEEILQKSDHLNKYCWDRLLNTHSLKIIASQI
mgnify:FL=1|tara:strand:- start:234 stop:602 length:369 start_codon:yes stop_codon:yes gene_type:complete